MKSGKTRLPLIAYFTLEIYLLGLTCLWCCLDLFQEVPGRKLYQDRYDCFYQGGLVGVMLLLVASFFLWRIRRWAAILGFATCLFLQRGRQCRDCNQTA